MGDNSVNKSINIDLSEENEQSTSSANSFSDAIDSLADVALERYEEKTSNITQTNVIGHIRCNLLNQWVQENYGFRHNSLDLIVSQMPRKSMSKGGFGLTKLIEIVKGINVSYEQNEGLKALRENMLRPRG